MQAPRKPPGTPPKRSPAPIGVLLEEARDASARAGGIVLDRERWRNAVGERIANRTEPGRLRSGVLTVHAASSAWAQELTFLAPEILERVKALGVEVTSLRFVVRPDVKRPEPRPAPAKPPPKKPLPEDLAARLAAVADPELRAAIAQAASEWLSRPTASAKERARDPRGAEARNAPKDRGAARFPGASRGKP